MEFGNLNSDLIIKVLSLVPLKPRTIFKLVCKTWHDLIIEIRRSFPQITSYGLVVAHEHGTVGGVNIQSRLNFRETTFFKLVDHDDDDNGNSLHLELETSPPGLIYSNRTLINSCNGILVYGVFRLGKLFYEKNIWEWEDSVRCLDLPYHWQYMTRQTFRPFKIKGNVYYIMREGTESFDYQVYDPETNCNQKFSAPTQRGSLLNLLEAEGSLYCYVYHDNSFEIYATTITNLDLYCGGCDKWKLIHKASTLPVTSMIEELKPNMKISISTICAKTSSAEDCIIYRDVFSSQTLEWEDRIHCLAMLRVECTVRTQLRYMLPKTDLGSGRNDEWKSFNSSNQKDDAGIGTTQEVRLVS
ncbi:hypothetical protein ACFE04_030802 [Oxalis oulophora]